MRLLVSALLLAAAAHAVELPYFAVLSRDAGCWPKILGSIGFEQRPPEAARVFVARDGSPAAGEWTGRVKRGAVLILEGNSPLAEQFGFKAGKETVAVTSLRDIHKPDLPIIWERRQDLRIVAAPPEATVFARERWTGAPMTAGLRLGAGAVLWIATSPGERGYERFPYVLQSLRDLGVEPPLRSSHLWAFFDSSYRSRVDLDYFAARWRRSGIAALHVAAWHFYEPDPERDGYLAKLIEACHREGILVYAWFELPHVSDQFWADHPEWREKTAILQDAQLDWRKLMNLTNRDCFRAVSAGVKALVNRFDWDGANLAELYFESLEGIGNPSRFTPMNDDVREQFRRQSGFDPIELFRSRRDEKSRRTFLNFRSELTRKMQQEWIGELEDLRSQKPDLDLVLTQVDDRFEPAMRDAIGADAARILPLLNGHNVTMMIEDPATVWNLGAERYQTIAESYRRLTSNAGKLAIDLNIADRYQNVYPTKQQTGTELFELVRSAAVNFKRVALYFESSLLSPDLGLLSAASVGASSLEQSGPKVTVTSDAPAGLAWKGSAKVDGAEWPAGDGETVWLPAGAHTVEPGDGSSAFHLLRLNGDLKTARTLMDGRLEFSYESSARAIAILDRPPKAMWIDGQPGVFRLIGAATVILPRGSHLVTITTE
jgi:hypothetical protein